MSFPRYERYKESGVEWLGEVPEGWEIGALKYFVISSSNAIKTGPFGSQLTSSEMQTGDIKVYNQRNVIDGDLYSGDNYITVQKFKELSAFEAFPGDLLITTRGTIGKTAVLPTDAEKGILHPCLIRVQADSSKLNTHYLQTLLQDSHLLKTQISILSNATTIEVIYSDTLASLILPIPPLPEQYTIAAFLNRETGKIDELVAEQERLIELLKEKRQTVISHAVTKGLNPDSPKKDSGIEWLGEVPVGWEVCALKRRCELITDGAHVSPETENGVFCFVSTKDIGDDFIDFENCLRTSESSYECLVKAGCKPHVGDLLFSKDGTIGRTVVVQLDYDFVVASSLIIIRPDVSVLDPAYLNYLCKSNVVAYQVEGFVKGAGLPRLSIQNLLKVIGVFPPRKDQSAIIAFLDSEIAKLDALHGEAQQVTGLLKERRSALISAAVTGKINVRGFSVTNEGTI